MFKNYDIDFLNIKLNNYQWNKLMYLSYKYFLKYHDKIIELKNKKIDYFDYDFEVEYINKYNLLVKNFLNELASEFKIFKFFSVTIFITGSFARFSNKTNSDVDLHFLYNNLFKRFIYKYEEMYFYIVSYVLDIKRNNIHSVITTKLNKKISFNNKDLNVKLYKNENNYISYLFYSTTKKRFFLQYNNSKSYYSFNKYISLEILNKNREWAHNFYVVMNEKKI